MKIVHRKDADEISNTVTIPDLLRKIACNELISYYAYIAASTNIKGKNWADAKQQFDEHAKEELEHFESILSRLYQLGQPCMAVFKNISTACGYYWDMDVEDPMKCCELAKVAEEAAIKDYQDLLVAIANTDISARDFATQRLAKKNLENEQDHLQDMIHLLAE